MLRQVKGVLFLDYVRMIRSHKGVDWSQHLPTGDLAYLSTHIDPASWYPMASFERLGNAILKVIARNQLLAVRMWGRFSVDQLRKAQPVLVAEGDPLETLNRFRVLRSTYFDFDALEVIMMHEGAAEIEIDYYMGMPAEEAASYQTMGFFERQIELAGGHEVEARFKERVWAGEPRTLLALAWTARR